MTIKRIIEIDIVGASTKDEIHDLLAQAFGFLDYYGKNWDAFDECIRDLGGSPQTIRIKGFRNLEMKLPREANLLMECLQEYQQTEDAQGMEVEIE